MIVKESISTEEDGIYESGKQKIILRPEKWYREFLIKHGFNIIESKFHDRSADCGTHGYNDEILFCLKPIKLSARENLKFGLKADAVIID
jgi:hypothetical protein